MNIRNWYMKEFPTDDLGKDIRPTATFEGLYDALLCGTDVYYFLGNVDSLIRERCFAKLAKMKNVDYDVIYHMWINVD